MTTQPSHSEALREQIPTEILDLLTELGPIDWAATEPLGALGHATNMENSCDLTAEHFGLTGPQAMNFLALEGTGTVVAYVGISPNSPTIARALVGAWNYLHDLATSPAIDCEAGAGTLPGSLRDVAQGELSVDFARSFPGGATDTSTFDDIETALDRVNAPAMIDGRWLTLPERIATLPSVVDPDDVCPICDGGPGNECACNCGFQKPASPAIDDAGEVRKVEWRDDVERTDQSVWNEKWQRWETPHPAPAADLEEQARVNAAKIIGGATGQDPWWWDPFYDDGSDVIATGQREDDLKYTDLVIAALGSGGRGV